MPCGTPANRILVSTPAFEQTVVRICPEHLQDIHIPFPNECLSAPCQHGGSCVDSVASYLCKCTHSWTGVDCDIIVDRCKSNPCQNGANCTAMIDGYSCGCLTGWSGHRCSVAVQPCDDSTNTSGTRCSQNATCVAIQLTNGTFIPVCSCFSGFSTMDAGLNCVAIDDCGTSTVINGSVLREETHGCINGGICVDHISNYTCVCAAGFGGELCESAVHSCEEGSCHAMGIFAAEVTYSSTVKLGASDDYFDISAIRFARDETLFEIASNGFASDE